MPKHTQGPWAVHWDQIDRFHGGELIRPEKADEGNTKSPLAVVCDFNRHDRDEERQANARLIAAAPELYDAAVYVLAEIRMEYRREGSVDLAAAIKVLATAIASAGGDEAAPWRFYKTGRGRE